MTSEKMKKGAVILIFMIFSEIIAINLISAGDVAYIYNRKFGIDNNFITIFNEMNLTVDLIQEKNVTNITGIKQVNLQNYRLIFVGDERFTNAGKIPVGSVPTVITNYYYGYAWGLTDTDGISKLTATAPLEVMINTSHIQVYTQAKDGMRFIEYFYLDNDNKAPGMQRAAGTYTGSNFNFGDAISYASNGTSLLNGKTTKGKLCFYGLDDSKFWTPAAKQMFKDCVGFVGSKCSKDSDCPSQQTGADYCIGNDLYHNIMNFRCINPGTVQSECSDDITPELVEHCPGVCMNGACVNITCHNDSECSDLNPKTMDICNFPGTINSTCSHIPINCTLDSDCDDLNPRTEDKCMNPGNVSSFCRHQNITCLSDGECGISGFIGNETCSGNNLARNFLNFTCNNPGTSLSYCANITQILTTQTCLFGCLNGACTQCTVNSDCGSETKSSGCSNKNVTETTITPTCQTGTCINITATKSVRECKNTCSNGQCTAACYNDSECDDLNLYTIDTCNNQGTPDAFCTHTLVNCIINADCGITGFIGNETCSGNNVIKQFQNATCINPGTILSYCSLTSSPNIIKTCSDSCQNGVCVNNTCHNDDECGVSGFIGSRFCIGKSVFQDYRDFDCLNPNTLTSNCTSNTAARNIENCTSDCLNGSCVNIRCYADTDCNDQNNRTEDKCINPGTTGSYCTNNPIICTDNIDCGVSGFIGNFYCTGNNVFRDFQSYICMNSGTSASYCNALLNQTLVQNCPDKCYLGSCVKITCYNDSECDDGNQYTTDTCQFPGTINSTCSHGNIRCINSNDCGTNMFTGNNFCDGISGKDVFRDFLTWTCSNPGTIGSYCSSSINSSFLNNCTYACSNGTCVRCIQNSECNDSSNRTYDLCHFAGTPDSFCTNEPITCFSDIECGVSGFIGNPFCSVSNLFQNYRTFSCINPGSVGSFCSIGYNMKNIQNCSFGCVNSSCMSGLHDVALIDFTNSIGGIRIRYANLTNIPDDPAQLLCNQNYEIGITAKNLGDFSENVTFSGSIGPLTFSHVKIDNFAPGSISSVKTRTVNLTLAEGSYNITIGAIIPFDSNPGNNTARRQISVLCPGCISDSGCPADSFTGDYFCKNNDSYRKFANYSCVNTGSENQCQSILTDMIIGDCVKGCTNGVCIAC